MNKTPIHTNTFICANTKNGFVTHQNQLMNCSHLYIIKGGPGTGKSSFMKKIAEKYKKDGHETELIHCSSDPDSLDGVYINSKSTLFFDGTAPHTQDLITPGAAGQIINLGNFWNEKKLALKVDEIKALNEDIKFNYAKAYSILKVAGELETAKDNIFGIYILQKKIEKYLNNFCNRIMKKQKGIGELHTRFANSINHAGITSYLNDTPLAKNIYEIADSYNVILPKMLDIITNTAISNGYNVCAYLSPLNPHKKEFIVIKELNIGIGKCSLTRPYMKINTSRFTDTIQLKESKNRVNLYKKLINELLFDAVSFLKKTKILHDKLEEIYIATMDFKAVDKFTSEFIKKI